MSLPGIIGERCFNLIDRDRDGVLSVTEFQNGLARFFCSTFEEKVGLIFDLYDFDEDGCMNGEDIKTMLSHVPLTQVLEAGNVTSPKEGKYTRGGGSLYVCDDNNWGRVLFLDRLQSQEELAFHIQKFMGDKSVVNKAEFTHITETVSSTVFLCVSQVR